MESLFQFFVKNKKFTFVLSFALIVFGYSGLRQLASETFPTVNIGTVNITTIYDGANAEDIETKITKPIEDEIRTVQGVKEVRSISQPGISNIITVVDIDNYDVEEVIPDLQRAVDQTRGLPSDLREPPDFFEVKSDELPVIELAVTGDNTARRRDIIAERLKEDLEDNKNISTIRIDGGTDRQFSILLNPKKLRKNYVSVLDVSRAVQTRNLSFPGGFLENTGEQKILKIEGRVSSTEELGSIVVRTNFSGSKVRLKDVATIRDGFEDQSTLTRYNGQESTNLVITKKSGVDAIVLAGQVEAVLANYRSTYGGYGFHIYNNEGNKVSARVDVLASNAYMGLALVILFLLIFLPGKPGLMASLSLPLAVAGTMGYMATQGMTLNTITIVALIIALGMLVDNSVVIAENFNRLRNEDGLSGQEAAVKAVSQLWLPVTVTALTTIAAFMPMLVTKGVMGQFIKFIPILVTVSLIMSLIESFFLLPARLAAGSAPKSPSIQLASEPKKPRKDWFQKSILPVFNLVMSGLLRVRYLTALGFMAIIGTAFFVMSLSRFDLFPANQTEVYIARVSLENGTDIKDTHKALEEVTARVLAVYPDQINHGVSLAGNDFVDPADPKGKKGENVGLIKFFVNQDMRNNAATAEVLNRMRTIEMPANTEVRFEAQTNGPPVGEPVNAIFRANDENRLRSVTERMVEQMSAVEGIYDVRIDDVESDPELAIRIDYDKAARLGLNVSSIGQTVRTAIAGSRVSNINLNDEEVQLFVRMDDSFRSSAADLKKLQISTPNGKLVPLSAITELEENPSTLFRKRFDFKRAQTLTASIDDTKMTVPIANAKLAEFYDEIKGDYPEVSLTFAGAGQNTRESVDSLKAALTLSIIGIFALLVFLFNSFVRPFIILTTIPLGLIGFAIAFKLQDMPISFMALIGIVGLGGIIVNSGIVLMSFIDEMRKDSQEDLRSILIRASGIRLKAVMVTALTTVSGLMPTAYGLGGADALIIPMTMAMAWGLVSGTILALIWVPCAYAILEDVNMLGSWLVAKFGQKTQHVEQQDKDLHSVTQRDAQSEDDDVLSASTDRAESAV